MRQAEYDAEVSALTEAQLLTRIDELISPKTHGFLNNFAKRQPYEFYIDDRVSIRGRRRIYATVKALARLRGASGTVD
jgi:hypothetical protein